MICHGIIAMNTSKKYNFWKSTIVFFLFNPTIPLNLLDVYAHNPTTLVTYALITTQVII